MASASSGRSADERVARQAEDAFGDLVAGDLRRPAGDRHPAGTEDQQAGQLAGTGRERDVGSEQFRGQVRAVGEAATPYRPNDAQTAHHIARFVTLVRSLSIDPIVVRQNWLDAYDYTTDKGAAVLNDYARVNDPFARIGKESVTVQITSVVRASDTSFNVRWTERRYVNGAAAGLERWTAVVSIVLQPPRTEERLRQNPLGIYVNGLSWSRELDSSEGAKP